MADAAWQWDRPLMVRIALVEIGLFLLPFLAFGLFLWFRGGEVTWLERWSTRNFAICMALAVVFVAGGLYFLEVGGRSSGEGHYVPPVWKDGVMVPGHYEPVAP